MTAYVIKRLLLFIPTVVIVTFVAFFIVNILPGDAAFLSMVGEGEGAEKIDPEVLENVRRELGIDRPILVQYVDWFGGVLTGDFGTSFKTKTPVIDALERRFPLTIQLAVMSVIISMVLAVPLGVWSAVKQDSGVDYGTKVFTILFVAAPTFWTALLLQTALVIWAGWLPPLKYVALWDGPLANLEILIFPAMVLGLHDMAFIARLTRSLHVGSPAGGLRADCSGQGIEGLGCDRAAQLEERLPAHPHRLRVEVFQPHWRHCDH